MAWSDYWHQSKAGKPDIIERLQNDDMVLDAIDDAIDEIKELRDKVEKQDRRISELERDLSWAELAD